MKRPALVAALAVVVGWLIPIAPASASDMPVLNVCQKLNISPCPEGLDRIPPTGLVRTTQGDCQVTFGTYGPGTFTTTDPTWGTYTIRYLFIGSGVQCDKAADLTAFAETVPAERTTSGSVVVDRDACLGGRSCWATAGWGHSDFLVGYTPICAFSSAAVTIDNLTVGPYFPASSVQGVNCM